MVEAKDELPREQGITFFSPDEEIQFKPFEGTYGVVNFQSETKKIGDLGTAFLFAEEPFSSDSLVLFIQRKGILEGKVNDVNPNDKPFIISVEVEPAPLLPTVCRLSLPGFKMTLETGLESKEIAMSSSCGLTADAWRIVSESGDITPTEYWLLVEVDPRVLSQMHFSFKSVLPRP